MNEGLRSARPSSRANSALVTGAGAVALIGPTASGRPQREPDQFDPVLSGGSRASTDVRCRARPPTPSRNGGSILGSAPPSALEHEPGSEAGDACPARTGGHRLRLPAAAHAGEEVVPGSGVFGDDLVCRTGRRSRRRIRSANTAGGVCGFARSRSRAAASRRCGCPRCGASAQRSIGVRRSARRPG